MRVKPGPETISLQSLSASLFDADGERPANVTDEQLSAANEQLREVFDLNLNTTLSWDSTTPKRGGASANATLLRCRTDVRLKLRLPPPFTRVPRPLVQGALGIVMKFVGNAILPRFANLLESDYQRWCNGTRELTRGLGSLTLDQDGYLVVPDEVLQKMSRAPGGSERLTAAGAQLDLDGTKSPTSDSSVAPSAGGDALGGSAKGFGGGAVKTSRRKR